VKDNVKTIVYAAVLGLVCASLLTGAGRLAAPYRKANELAEEVRNILAVLGVPFAQDASSQELVEIYQRNVRLQQRGELTLYIYADPVAEGEVQAMAVPFVGQGLWGPVRGFLALEPDMKTIRGVSFYHQEETPGLGGEIGSAWFQEQFKGKLIEDPEGRLGIRVARGEGPRAPNEVDAISGATMTSQKVEEMLNAAIALIRKERGGYGP
jgi:Na+-transporting NADH:ubiquinone oxidoreductase subunit C